MSAERFIGERGNDSESVAAYAAQVNGAGDNRQGRGIPVGARERVG